MSNPHVTVRYLPDTKEVDFSPDRGKVIMKERGTITFRKGGSHDFSFESFSLDPPSNQFSDTVAADSIDVHDAFADKVETKYKYTIGIRLPNGTMAYGDPQIINQPQ